jgi:drug/metabolite transporter (DMT)-like permease
MTRRQAVGWLILVCLVWGVSFTLTKEVLEDISPLLFMGIRFGLASLPLLGTLRHISRYELLGGLLLGVLFWAGFTFQTFGLAQTTASRSAFITSLSTPLVPIVYFLVHRHAPDRRTIGALLLAAFGMYLLTLPDTGGGGLNRGDLLTLGCALMFAAQIVAVGHFSQRGSPLRLLAIELMTTAVLSFLFTPVVETPRIAPNAALAGLILFLSLSGLWSFYMQIRAQQVLTPTHTALLFMLEPVFAAITSIIVLGERLRMPQWVGAGLILAAMAVPTQRDPFAALRAGSSLRSG